MVSDGRHIYLSNEYADPPESINLDLLEMYQNPNGTDVEDTVSQLKSWITGLYEGEWNEYPSKRDISDDDIFGEFIEASRSALNEDILPSIERRFESYEEQWEQFQEERAQLLDKQEELQSKYRNHTDWDAYQEAIDKVAEDLRYDYEDHLSGSSSSDTDEERWIDEVAEFRDNLLALENELSDLETEYRYAIQWHQKWNRWLDITGKDYEGANKSDKEDIRETFQLQTLNVLYNRILLIRTFEDMGIIGQVISNGFMKFFDEKVKMRENQYTEPLTTASRQAEEVYSPLFRRDTPHDWYHWEEPVIRTVLRRFDNFNFKNIDRDIFGSMYQQCLDPEKRKRLGAYYTPPEAVGFLLDYSGFTSEEQNIKTDDDFVLDPACGSGTFVLESINRVMNALDDSGYDFSRDDDLLEAINLVNQKIRGFDIDPYPVQLAQSNLLIRVLQERQGAASNGDTHLEFPSFSIYETDSLLTAKDSLDSNKDRFYRARESDSEHVDDIIDAKEADYSWIIGNPPYVRSHNQDERVTTEYERLHDTFGDNQSDVFVGFVEQALKWLEDGGKLAFVISNKLLVTEGSEDAMRYILNNSTVDFVGDLTRCKVFGFDVNVFPILIVLTKRSGEEYEEERKDNTTDVVKVYPKGSKETNEWVHALDHAAAELLSSRDEPDYDFATDFESEEYPDITTKDTYDHYEIPQSRFIEDWGDWTDSLTLNYQINETLWEAVCEMENGNECHPLSNLCKMDGGGRGGSSSRGEEPRYYRPYTSEERTDDADVPVIGGKNIEQFYLGDASGDVEEYIDVDAIEQDSDTDVSDNKLEAFKKDKIAYRETAPRLSFVVDAASEATKFYNKTAYFLLLQDDGGLDRFTDRTSALDPHYIAGLLNSDVLDFYYKAYYEHLSFRHAPAIRCRPSHLHHTPIRLPDQDTREQVASYSKDLHQAKREKKEVNHAIETLFETYQERGDTVQFRTKIASVIESRPDYAINTFTVSRSGTEVELNRYYTVDMHSEEEAKKLASFLGDFGDEYIGGDKLRNLELPSDLNEFREEYEDLKERHQNLSSDIDDKMSELNGTVYELYGIEEYREDIEEYLDTFLKVIQ